MKTSQAGTDLIKRFEGCKLKAYQDIVGVWSNGYGNTKGVEPGSTITQQEAEDTLAQRLANEFEPAVMRAIGSAQTTQNQFDAMVSLAWNIGPAAFEHKCSVPRRHKEGDYEAAAKAFALWNRAGGRIVAPLVHRRAEEAALYSAKDIGDEPVRPDVDDIDYEWCAKIVQAALQAADLYNGNIDGKWGTKSRAAYDEFNRRV